MQVQVFFTPNPVEPAAVQGKTVVVVDVLRATSTVVEALVNGAGAIYPTSGTEDAIKLATSLGREDTLLCGERRGVRIEGYDLGNSPTEVTPDRVAGKRLVMNTTNGTRAFLATVGAERIVAGSFMNLDAVVRAVSDADDLVVLCAGREGRFSVDDVVCAGMILRRITAFGGSFDGLDDASRAALTLAESVSVDASFLEGTDAGRALIEIGMTPDLPLCAEVDRHDVVPRMRDRMIRLHASD